MERRARAKKKIKTGEIPDPAGVGVLDEPNPDNPGPRPGFWIGEPRRPEPRPGFSLSAPDPDPETPPVCLVYNCMEGL